MNPYEEAVKWLEKEVLDNGSFAFHREEAYVDIDKTRCYRAFPTGQYSGFTVSSQHVDDAGNFLQLIQKMRMEKEAREAKK